MNAWVLNELYSQLSWIFQEVYLLMKKVAELMQSIINVAFSSNTTSESCIWIVNITLGEVRVEIFIQEKFVNSKKQTKS